MSVIADIAASALETAAQALRAYSATVKALDARVVQIEAKLEMLVLKPPFTAPIPEPCMPTGIETESGLTSIRLQQHAG